MYTKEPRLGKFEGNPSQWEAEVVYDASMYGTSGIAGDISRLGWCASLVKGRKMAWIVFEDNYGFVDVTSFNTHDEAIEAFKMFEHNQV